MVISCDKIFLLVSKYKYMWFELAIMFHKHIFNVFNWHSWVNENDESL